jgi:hypothetical protein
VSALLDELLGEEAQLEVLEAQQHGNPQLSEDEQQQLAELHEEVDGCLASLELWEEESRLRREKLEKELEEQYGFSCQLELGSDAEGDTTQKGESSDPCIEEDQDLSRYLGGGDRHRYTPRDSCETSPKQRDAEQHSSDHVAFCTESHLMDRDATKRADAERLQRLRAEVDLLRSREASGLGPWDDFRVDEAGIEEDGTSALTAWCDEVDNVIGEAPFSSNLGGLTRVQNGLDEMDSCLSAAYSNVDADLHAMEKLLAECNAAIQANTANVDT